MKKKKLYWSKSELKQINSKIIKKLKENLNEWLYKIFIDYIDIEPPKYIIRQMYREARQYIINKLSKPKKINKKS